MVITRGLTDQVYLSAGATRVWWRELFSGLALLFDDGLSWGFAKNGCQSDFRTWWRRKSLRIC